MHRKLRNRFLILFWEVIYLVKALPYWLTAGQRSSPKFVIIGASKSGTSSLFSYLSSHPQVKVSRLKEPRFFNRYYWLGINYYKSYFPLVKEGKVSGEATTSYFYHEKVPKRMKNYFPNLKLIVLLRNPIYRAYSHYQMNKNDDPSKDFLAALQREKEGKVSYHYIDSSSYMSQLNRWFGVFSKEQIMIIKSEQFFEETETIMKRLYQFLELDHFPIRQYDKVNENTYSPLSREEYKKAEPYFAEDMAALSTDLGDEFQWKYKA